MNRKKFGFTPLEMEVRISNRGGKRFLTGFTIVELLTSVAIIAMLVAMLVPALNMVRNKARETKQRAQFATIGMALMGFRADDGDYPPSGWDQPDYCGAQKLSEALLGWDLLGFHPDSAWRADGLDINDGLMTYDPPKTRDIDGDGVPDTLNERVEPYLELATTKVFTLRQLFGNSNPLWVSPVGLSEDRFVLCDSFATKKVTLVSGTTVTTVTAGAPILYYQANTSSKNHIGAISLADRIYNVRDNRPLVELMRMTDGKKHPLDNALRNFEFFYGDPGTGVTGYIQDPKVTARPWPYRADSYILISAGADGEYGTRDDICNFGN